MMRADLKVDMEKKKVFLVNYYTPQLNSKKVVLEICGDKVYAKYGNIWVDGGVYEKRYAIFDCSELIVVEFKNNTYDIIYVSSDSPQLLRLVKTLTLLRPQYERGIVGYIHILPKAAKEAGFTLFWR